MWEREFWQLLDEVFGHSYGRSIARDLAIAALDNRTVIEALADGVEPRIIWNYLCDQMDIDDDMRWGSAHNAPPLPAV